MRECDREDCMNFVRGTTPEENPCAQLVILPLPEVELEEVDDLSPSERGTGGFGSSDERRKV